MQKARQGPATHFAVIPGRREILGRLVSSSGGHSSSRGGGLVGRVDWVGVGIDGAALIWWWGLAFGLQIR